MTGDNEEVQRLLQSIETELKRLDRIIEVEPLAQLPSGGDLLRLPSSSSALRDAASEVEVLHSGKAFRASIPDLGVRVVIGGEALGALRRYETSSYPQPRVSWWRQLTQLLNRWSEIMFNIPKKLDDRQHDFLRSHSGAASTDRDALQSAVNALRTKQFKQKACAALQSFSGDLKEIYKPLVKFLLPISATTSVTAATSGSTPLTLSVAGVPLSAVALALLTIIISRAGIASLCTNVGGELPHSDQPAASAEDEG